MTSPIDNPPEPAFRALPFLAVQGKAAAASNIAPLDAPAQKDSAQDPKSSGSSVARSIANVALFAAFGAVVGYIAKPTIGETWFTNFDPESSPATVLKSGWSGFEQTQPGGDTFAWCASASCTLQVHTAKEADRIVRTRLWPFGYPDAPPQMLTIFVNGTSLGKKPVTEETSVLSFPAARSCWHEGDNEIRLQFAYAESPKSKYPGEEDERKLAAAFDWLEIVTP